VLHALRAGEAPVFVTQTAPANAESCVCRYFYLVQELSRPASGSGQVAVRWLEERPDGLWHPSTQTWDECRGALCVVRTQPCRDKHGRRCFKLLTLRSSIEAVELED